MGHDYMKRLIKVYTTTEEYEENYFRVYELIVEKFNELEYVGVTTTEFFL
jgi:hypothetical protein